MELPDILGLGGLGGQYPGQNKFVPLLKTFVHKLLLKAYIESKKLSLSSYNNDDIQNSQFQDPTARLGLGG